MLTNALATREMADKFPQRRPRRRRLLAVPVATELAKRNRGREALAKTNICRGLLGHLFLYAHRCGAAATADWPNDTLCQENAENPASLGNMFPSSSFF